MKIQPHRIVYEDFILDVESCISHIFAFLEIDRRASSVLLERDGGLARIYMKAKPTYDSLKDRFMDDFIRIGHTDDSVRLGPSLEKWNRFFFESGWRI